METLFELDGYGVPYQKVALIRPCPRCNERGDVDARYIVARNWIEARCPCGNRWGLDHASYGALFNVTRRSRRHRNAHDDDEFIPTDAPYTIFNRYGYRCVYHEGSEEARRLRLAQIDALASRTIATQTSLQFSDSRLRQALVGEGLAEDAVRNLFGLVPDHLIPRSWTRRIGAHLTPAQLKKCQREWVVAACTYCNDERKDNIERVDALLFIYSRYVMPHRGVPAIERLTDATDFLAVLHEIALAAG